MARSIQSHGGAIDLCADCRDKFSERGGPRPSRLGQAARPDGQAMINDVPIDLFITHAWRYHDEWKLVGSLLDGDTELAWRNFSVPWYDPALDPNTELGARTVKTWLEGQIRPVAAVIFLDGVYAIPSTRKWLDLEVAIARDFAKPIVGLPARGQSALSDAAQLKVDVVSTWDAKTLIAKIQHCLQSRQSG
jgi:hypothetical protein